MIVDIVWINFQLAITIKQQKSLILVNVMNQA